MQWPPVVTIWIGTLHTSGTDRWWSYDCHVGVSSSEIESLRELMGQSPVWVKLGIVQIG
jgi:hypothetical protein